MTPTIEQLMKTYRIISRIERAKTGRPCEETILNTLRGTRVVCTAAGISLNSDVDALTRKTFDKALASFMTRGLSRLSAWSYICQIRALFAKWCLPYYKDAGWDVPALELPSFRAQAPRYLRPSGEMLGRVKAWYKKQTGEHWFAATMMLEFAMRNGDVLRLKDTNFVENGNGRFLSYTPHKTELSSGRRVYWPIHDDIWQQFEDYGRLSGLDVTDETFIDINSDLRSMGFRGSKASYELRKICIDHVYQKYGAEMAVSISGDDIRTISRYYADPAQPNIGAVRITDLF
jgi:hypothetical protein